MALTLASTCQTSVVQILCDKFDTRLLGIECITLSNHAHNSLGVNEQNVSMFTAARLSPVKFLFDKVLSCLTAFETQLRSNLRRASACFQLCHSIVWKLMLKNSNNHHFSKEKNQIVFNSSCGIVKIWCEQTNCCHQ